MGGGGGGFGQGGAVNREVNGGGCKQGDVKTIKIFRLCTYSMPR